MTIAKNDFEKLWFPNTEKPLYVTTSQTKCTSHSPTSTYCYDGTSEDTIFDVKEDNGDDAADRSEPAPPLEYVDDAAADDLEHDLELAEASLAADLAGAFEIDA
eukprot:tig00021068_g17799.t2